MRSERAAAIAAMVVSLACVLVPCPGVQAAVSVAGGEMPLWPPEDGPSDGRQQYNDVEESWDFDLGLEAWGNSTAEQMGAEIFPRGEEMRLRIRSAHVYVDSPLFNVPAHDDCTLVVRMMYMGRSSKGSFFVRTWPDGTSLPPGRYATGDPDWTEDVSTWLELEFDVIPDGQYHTYYIPLYDFRNPTPVLQDYITQLRLHPVNSLASLNEKLPLVTEAPRLGQVVHVDFIRIAKQPTIESVLHCGWLPEKFKGNEIYPVHPAGLWVRPNGPLNQRFEFAEQTTETRYTGKDNISLPYGITYNCWRRGGERITLVGRNFGTENARVQIAGRPCTDVIHEVPNTHVSCVTPPGEGDKLLVNIANGNMPGLQDARPYLSYIVPPFQTRQPRVSNIAARSVHLNWLASDDWWDSLTITGFWIQRRYATDTSSDFRSQWEWTDWHGDVVTGNVTVTTVLGLEAGTEYELRIAPLAEDQVFSETWQELDLYGQRPPVPDYVRGNFSEPVSFKTLPNDFNFEAFDANATLDHGAWDKRNSSGQIGIETGEGHYGLVLVGDANIENCNASSTCCDGYSELQRRRRRRMQEGDSSDSSDDEDDMPAPCSLSCSARSAVRPVYINEKGFRDSVNEPHFEQDWDPKREGQETDPAQAPLPSPVTNFANGITVGPRENLGRAPRYDCGPALRLTSSGARLTGAAWYSKQQQVREGFETEFTFRLSNPSVTCKFMDDAYTRCRSRGADGFAFVIQNQHPAALGFVGDSLGYGGIPNSVAVEFDTYMNFENLDPMENHISVHTRGWKHPNSPNHTYELGSAVDRVPDLTDGIHHVRIKYTPEFDEELVQDVSFAATPHMGDFVQDGDYLGGGMGTWGTGMGTLSIFFNRQLVPALIVPLNLAETLKLQNGRAWVGFTAATGTAFWQTHDILSWEFTQLREDWAGISNRYPPTVVNGVGKHECSGLFECPHPPSSPTGRSKQRDNKYFFDKDPQY